MPLGFYRAPWLARLVFFAGLSSSAAVAAERWLHGSSPHFQMLSVASEKESRRMLLDLERFRENVLAFLQMGGGSEPPVTVYLFPSMKAFRPYLPLYQGKPKEVAGYFINARDEVVIALTAETDPDGYEDPSEIIYHEYVHLLLHTRGLNLPPWLDEGFADVFSTLQVDARTALYGRPKDLYVLLLQQGALIPLPKLLQVTHGSPDYNEEMRATMFYAQSWAFTHFLLCGTDRSNLQKLMRYLRALEAPGADAFATFTEIFGRNWSKLEHDLRNYLEGGQYFQRQLPARPIDEAAVKLRAATDFERELGQVSLGFRVTRAADAHLRLLHLAQQNPTSPRPHELLAVVAAEQGDALRAFEAWRKAVELKSESALSYVQLARAEMLQFDIGNFDARLAPEVALDLQRWLDRAMALRPGFPEAIETLAEVEARAPTLRIYGINQVQQAVPKLIERDRTLLALAVIRWRANDPETCLRIVDAVLASSRATVPVKAAARALKLRASGSDAAPAPAVPAKPRSSLAPSTGTLLESTRRPVEDDTRGGPRPFLDPRLADPSPSGRPDGKLDLELSKKKGP